MPRKAKARNLYQRDGIWWACIKVAGYRHRSSLRTSDLSEAKIRLEGWRQKLERRAVGVKEDRTFREAVVRWGETVLPGSVKPAVARRYITSIHQLDRIFGRLRMSQITTATISDYLESRAGAVSNATLTRDLTALSRLLSACVAWGWRQDNPARYYDRTLTRERREPIQPPSEADIATMVSMAPEGFGAVLRLLDATGMRENEAVSLERADVDWKRGQITLTRTKTNRPRALSWSTPAGDAGIVLQELHDRIGHLFISERGEPFRNFASNFGRLRRRVIEECRKVKKPFRPFRVHDLRHGFAIRWLKRGGDIYQLQHHLGHSSIQTTERYLGYLTIEERTKVQAVPQKVPQQG